MGPLRSLLALALLALVCNAEIKIYPSSESMVHDVTSGTNPVLFTCTAEGHTVQSAQLKWFNNASQQITGSSGRVFLEDTGSDLKLRIPRPTQNDAGVYTCSGLINNEEQEKSILLELYNGIHFTSPTDQFAVSGTDAYIWCRMERTTLDKTISWYLLGSDGTSWTPIRTGDKYKMGFNTQEGEEGDYLMVRNISLDDSATYICNVDVKEIGRSHVLEIDVTVTIPPKFSGPITLKPPSPRENERLEMSCQATGTPAPTYMFRKDGRNLMEEPNTDGLFVIENVLRTDEGEYECEASNKGGTLQTRVTVDVKIPPTIVSNENADEQENSPVRLACEAMGDPVPTLSWRQQGSQVDILEDNTQPMYVEVEQGEPELDDVTKVYRKTAYLVIPRVQSSDAGDYICIATNDAGREEKTFSVVVNFKPNFNDQGNTVFYGWLNSRTNLTCIANGNPEPVITWFRGETDLSTDSNYKISNGQTDVRTRAISYLTPTVTNDDPFGGYSCRASNRFDRNVVQTLEFRKAVVPEAPGTNIVKTHPTALEMRLSPPAQNGGQPVTKYVVKYKIMDSSDDYVTDEVVRFQMESSTEMTLSNLIPATKYSIKVYAVNNVGMGKERNFMESTAEISKPDRVQVTSDRTSVSGSSYTLTWNIPMTGGAEISNYHVEYAVAEMVNTDAAEWTAVRVSPEFKTVNVDGQTTTQVTLTGLQRETYYQVRIHAVNKMGSSDNSTFIFRTGQGDGNSLGAGGIAALIIIVLLLLLVAVDAAFCKTKQCGAIWTISQAVGRHEEGASAAGKSPEDGDEAAAKLLGKEKDDTLRTENEVAKEAERADEVDAVPTEKKELEPEDKEEKPPTDLVAEEPVKPKAEETPAAPPAAGEAAPEVETQPAAEPKTDPPANA